MNVMTKDNSISPNVEKTKGVRDSSTKEKGPAFATPDRETASMVAIKAERGGDAPRTTEKETISTTVTPPESATREPNPPGGKSVRFDYNRADETDQKETVSVPLAIQTDSPITNRGLVSRRGGRYGSPSRAKKDAASPARGAVLEYKTYRSPQQKREILESDTIPSLCSSNSGGLQSTSSGSTTAAATATPSNKKEPTTKVDTKREGRSESKSKSDDKRPCSISCDTSQVDTTSPLASHDSTEHTPKKPSKTTPIKQPRLDDKCEMDAHGSRRNVAFSPSPPHREDVAEKMRKTPTRSPTGHQFQTLPSLQDAKLNSPCGIFLSPCPPSPSAYTSIANGPSFDEDKPTMPRAHGAKDGEKETEEEKAARARDQERERAVATPTDFAVDYGKGHRSSASFDASNVLAWLQSPTANGLFSPGGLGSVTSTPRGGVGGNGGPRTPRTPTVSTSFFFSDVACLPRNGEFASPKPEGGPKRGGGMSSMISISPLASSKRGPGRPYVHRDSRAGTPLDFKDVFASPRLPSDRSRPRSLPLLGESPAKGKPRTGDSDLDAVHMAERDLMEDEDLSVLLQLASNSNTPRSKDGSDVFRSPRRRKPPTYREDSSNRNPALQLPMIGREESSSTTKLVRKSISRDQSGVNAEDFTPPPLGIRSCSSGASREMFSRGDEEGGEKSANAKRQLKDLGKDAEGKGESSSKRSGQPKKSSGPKPNRKGHGPAPAPYPMQPYHPGAEAPVPYYPLPGSIPAMPPGGSMRVVVGGPPPPRNNSTKKSPSGSPPRHHNSSPSRPPPYPMQHPSDGYGPPGSMYPPPPPPGHYPHHPHPPPPMPGMVPPYGHYPPPHHPPRHVPMYPSQNPPSASKSSIKGNTKKPKAAKTPKLSAKRPIAVTSQNKTPTPAPKKAKKTSPRGSSSSKKKKSPAGASIESSDRPAKAGAASGANGPKNEKAAALAAAILRGVTMRPSGKWQAQLYYAGKSRYIGVFDTREKAALAYEIAREKLKSDNKSSADHSSQSLKETENAVNAARKAAFEGVNEKDPRLPSSPK